MPLDRFINSVRAEVAKRFDLKTDAEIDAFFIGLEESAKDNQESLEKRDKMLRDTVAELCKAKRLLKAAIEGFEFLGAWMDKYGECTLDCSDCPLHKPSYYCRGWNKQAEALALIGEDANVVHKSGGWISCKDNMPDTLERGLSTMYSDCCLVCDAFGWVGMAYYITDGQKSWWEFADAQNQNKIDWTEVTHWQPVPEPPKDGDT